MKFYDFQYSLELQMVTNRPYALHEHSLITINNTPIIKIGI